MVTITEMYMGFGQHNGDFSWKPSTVPLRSWDFPVSIFPWNPMMICHEYFITAPWFPINIPLNPPFYGTENVRSTVRNIWTMEIFTSHFHPIMYDILWFARIIPFFIHIFIHPLFPTTELRHASELKLKDWRKTLRVFSDAAMSKFQKVGHGLVEASWDIAKKRPSGKHTTSYWKWDLRGIYGNLWCFTLWQTFTSLQAIENHHFIVGKWTRNDHFQ